MGKLNHAAKVAQTDASPGGCDAATGSPPVVLTVPLDTPEGSCAELRAAGFIPVKTDAPDKVRIISGSVQVIGDDLLMSVLEGLMTQWATGDYRAASQEMRTRALQELHRRLKIREANAERTNEGPKPL